MKSSFSWCEDSLFPIYKANCIIQMLKHGLESEALIYLTLHFSSECSFQIPDHVFFLVIGNISYINGPKIELNQPRQIYLHKQTLLYEPKQYFSFLKKLCIWLCQELVVASRMLCDVLCCVTSRMLCDVLCCVTSRMLCDVLCCVTWRLSLGTQTCQLQCLGLVALKHVRSQLPDQGLNPHPLHCKAGS